MPKIATYKKWRIRIYTNDHEPPHVHVIGDGEQAVFHLNCEHRRRDATVDRSRVYNMKRRDIARIREHLSDNINDYCAAWERIHG